MLDKTKRGFARWVGEQQEHSHSCSGQRGAKTAQELRIHCESFGRQHLTVAQISTAVKRGWLS